MKAGRVSRGRDMKGGGLGGSSRVAEMLRRKRSWEIRALLLSQFDVFIKVREFVRMGALGSGLLGWEMERRKICTCCLVNY